MDLLIADLESAFASFDAQQIVIPARAGFNYAKPYPGLVEWMPLLQRGERMTLKLVGYHPENPVRFNLPTVLSTVSEFDATTGHLTALIDGTFLTALRTGAASAVASRLLANPGSSCVGLIGCGAQAVSQLHALGRVFDLDQVFYFDSDEAAQESFVARTSGLVDASIEFCALPLEQIVERADILSTATSIDIGEGPLFDGISVQPHLHINAVGSDFPGKTELPVSLLREAFVCPDFMEQAVHEGECQQLHEDQIGSDLASVMQANDELAALQSSLTVFDSTGYALEDQVVMRLFLDLALKLNVGQQVEIEGHSDDPKDPYGFLWEVGLEASAAGVKSQ